MQPKTSNRYLVLIGIFKLVKGVILSFVTIGFLGLLHKDLQEVATDWIEWMHFDPDDRYIGGLLERLGLITERQIKVLCLLTAFYAAIFLTEGLGLLFKKRWAEYFTLIVTASFIPLEIYEVSKHFHPAPIALLIVNVGIACFLATALRKEARV